LHSPFKKERNPRIFVCQINRACMKKRIQHLLQRLLGFESYLFWFARFKIMTFKSDRNERDFFHFLALLKPDQNVLDIGANIGITSVWLSRTLPQGQIHSFEPVPPNYQTLNRIVRAYQCSNVTLHQLALGAEPGEVELVMPEVEQVQMQGLSHVVHEELTDFNEGRRFKAQIVTLDGFPAIQDVLIHAIKLDVENFEAFVLEGALELIQSQRPIIYTELWENDNRQRCFDLIQSFDYRIQCLIDGQLVDFDADQHQTQNFFFLP
ncbi:MAG: FkbM family methyltransferase, partial [Bacteroidota bacterium]